MSDKNITIEEFMVRKLGGEASVFSEYLREVADLNRAGGSRRTLGEIIQVAEEHGCKDWLMRLTLPEISGYFFVEPDKGVNKYCRRSKVQIEETRGNILNLLRCNGGVTVESLSSSLDIDPDELRRKDLPALKKSGEITSKGKGNDAVYSLVREEGESNPPASASPIADLISKASASNEASRLETEDTETSEEME